jgi:hypothetical protein
VWSWKASIGHAALVVAMTLALAVGSEIPVDDGEIVIYPRHPSEVGFSTSRMGGTRRTDF